MTIVIQTKWTKLDNVDEIKIYLGMPSHSTPFSWHSYDGLHIHQFISFFSTSL
jgi:hypothetical protein